MPSATQLVVLLVDDDRAVRTLLERVVRREGHVVLGAASGEEARHCLRSSPDVVLLDIDLPDGSGLEMLQTIQEEHPDTGVVMVSGDDDPATARSALDSGAYGYITKPFAANAVQVALYNAARRRDLERQHREQRASLAEQVEQRTAELSDALSRLGDAMLDTQRACTETIFRLSKAIEYRDPETSGHVARMSRYCGVLARSFGLDEELIRAAGSMHDVGKIGIPDAVLLKPGPLDPEERRIMQRHTIIGHDLLFGSGSSLLDEAATIALSHHERWDGMGYPNRLAGEEIPLVGRIAAVADVFDALTTPRVYRQSCRSPEQARDFICEQSGAHFDPSVVHALLAASDELDAIRLEASDADPAFAVVAAAGS